MLMEMETITTMKPLNQTNMWNYIKYFFKVITGVSIIIALDVILKKADPYVGNWWLYITIASYHGYCYLEFRLTNK